MTKKAFVFLFAVVFAVAYVFFFDRQVLDYEGGAKSSAEQSSGLIVGKNAIYVSDQAPSSKIAAEFVLFEKPGFVVVHEGGGESPGAILGASGFVPVGRTENLPPIALSRETRDGEMLFAMLHGDDGDGVFDPQKDKPATESEGELVMMQFIIDAGAELPGAVSL